MMPRPRRFAFALGALLGTPLAASAGPLALADIPLTASSGVTPNVMFLVDNSGSMNNIIWAEGYEHTFEYPQWQRTSEFFGWTTMTRLNGNVSRSELGRGSCDEGWSNFRKTGDTPIRKCLRLPDPVGSQATRYDGNYLNYLAETFADGTDLTSGAIPVAYRMRVARDVTRALIADTPGMRFGVSHFNVDEGGAVAAECGSTAETLNAAVDGLSASTWTPLAESLYEVTRYFRGMSSHYNDGVEYTSPIQYRCQKNFAIVVTDGMPTYDTSFPSDDAEDAADAGRSLPDWDGISTATTSDMHPNYPAYSDGFATGAEGQEGNSLFLDDIAKFAWDIDFVRAGSDAAGKSYEDARFSRQNMHTYTVGFAASNRMLRDAAEYGHGTYSTATNAAGLSAVLQAALRDIVMRSGSSSAAAANAGFIGEGSRVYQARFNTADWSGQLLAFNIDTDPSSANYGKPTPRDGDGNPIPTWDAAEEIPAPDARAIITSRNGNGFAFRWASFTSAADSPPPEVDEQEAYFDNRPSLLAWLRGADVDGLRNRASKLGDIVNSAPVFVGAPGLRYPDSLESAPYSAFKTAKRLRPGMLYVGANDGMLHGLDANSGAERLAYVPGVLLPRIKALPEPDYTHQYFADGSPTVSDAFISGAWRTILVGGLNKGGQAVFALDVTAPTSTPDPADPAIFSEMNAASIVKWEFDDSDDADLGFTFSQPSIAKLRSSGGHWAAIFGNGYNNSLADTHVSSTGNAALYVVDLADGTLLRKLDTGVGTAADPTGADRPNGLASVTPVDMDGDYRVDRVYAGDLFGNLWRFDVSNADPAEWSAARLFTACGGDVCTTGATSNRQPITSRPSVGRHPSGSGVLVFFGTGKYLETTDNNGPAGGRQSFYAVWDRGEAVTSRTQLLRQSILAEGPFAYDAAAGRFTVVTDPGTLADGTATQHLRVTSNNPVSWATHKGWYIDLTPPSGTGKGERQVTASTLRNKKIVFTTTIPTSDPCTPGGESWLMELDAEGGGRLAYSPFDVSLDHVFTDADLVEVTIDGATFRVPSSGIRLDDGGAASPLITAGLGNREFKHIPKADGLLQSLLENPGTGDTGRQSWRELGR